MFLNIITVPIEAGKGCCNHKIGSCRHLKDCGCWYWELTVDPLEESHLLITTAISLQAHHLFSYCTDIEVYGDLFSFPRFRIILLIIFRKTLIYDCCLYPVMPMLSWNSANKKVITATNPQSWVPGIARLNKPIFLTETANNCSCLSPWLCPEGLKSVL